MEDCKEYFIEGMLLETGLNSDVNSLCIDESEFSGKKIRSDLREIYPCNHMGCKKSYSQKYRLEIHKRTHVNFYFLFFRLEKNLLNVNYATNLSQKKET